MSAIAKAVFSVIGALQLAAMALLVIVCVSAPVSSEMGLSHYEGTIYGVFGYCDGDRCSKAAASYEPYNVGRGSDGNWKMSNNARRILGKILIVAPVAAGLNLFSFLSSLVSFIVDLASGSTSGFLFVQNLVMTVIGFLASALVCIVVFLLFYPNIAWCSWLLIPAAACQLIAIPLVFVAHSSRGNSDDEEEGQDDLRGIVQHDTILDTEFESPSKQAAFYNDTNNTTDSLSEKPLILPSYGYGKLNKQEEVVRVESDNTTDHSTSGKDPYEVETDSRSHLAFSAIQNVNHTQPRPPVSLSMASSEYSSNYAQSDLHKEPRDVLEDIINDSLSKEDAAENHMRSASDNGSDFTSISQRAARQPMPPMPHVQGAPVPFAAQQQRMPPNGRSAGPDPTEMLLQNSPNFIQTNGRRMQPPVHHQPPQFAHNQYQPRAPNGYGGFQNNVNPVMGPPVGSGTYSSTNYKPAYKKRVSARNNMVPPASSIDGRNPYQFR